MLLRRCIRTARVISIMFASFNTQYADQLLENLNIPLIKITH